jgi:hypothetical protein
MNGNRLELYLMNKELNYMFWPIFALSGIRFHSECAKNVKVKKKSLDEKDVRTLYNVHV